MLYSYFRKLTRKCFFEKRNICSPFCVNKARAVPVVYICVQIYCPVVYSSKRQILFSKKKIPTHYFLPFSLAKKRKHRPKWLKNGRVQRSRCHMTTDFDEIIVNFYQIPIKSFLVGVHPGYYRWTPSSRFSLLRRHCHCHASLPSSPPNPHVCVHVAPAHLTSSSYILLSSAIAAPHHLLVFFFHLANPINTSA